MATNTTITQQLSSRNTTNLVDMGLFPIKPVNPNQVTYDAISEILKEVDEENKTDFSHNEDISDSIDEIKAADLEDVYQGISIQLERNKDFSVQHLIAVINAGAKAVSVAEQYAPAVLADESEPQERATPSPELM